MGSEATEARGADVQDSDGGSKRAFRNTGYILRRKKLQTKNG